MDVNTNKIKCPKCHYIFVDLMDPLSVRTVDNRRMKCPKCRSFFIFGSVSYSGVGCNTCELQHDSANNVYYKDGCPALMSDGRFLTYYNSTNELTETMRKMNGFESANKFRTFMQTNGDLLMASERDYLNKENTCAPATACSEGWFDLWTKKYGYWANDYASNYSLNR